MYVLILRLKGPLNNYRRNRVGGKVYRVMSFFSLIVMGYKPGLKIMVGHRTLSDRPWNMSDRNDILSDILSGLRSLNVSMNISECYNISRGSVMYEISKNDNC